MPLSLSSTSSRSSTPQTQRLRPRRPKSPVSLYVASYGFDGPKEPKPLVKLEPKEKSKPRSGTLSSLKSLSNHSPSSSFDSQMSLSSSSSKTGKSRSPSISGSVFGLGRRKSLVKAPPPLPLRPSIPSLRHLGDDASIIDTPTLASFIPPSDVEIKRHQLEKVSRTLGEDIPPSLIFRDLGRLPDTGRISRKSSVSSFQTENNEDSIPPTPSSDLRVSPTRDSPKASPTGPRFRRPKTAPSPRPSISLGDTSAETSAAPQLDLPPSEALRLSPLSFSPHPSTAPSNSSVLPSEGRRNVHAPSRRPTDPIPSLKTEPGERPELSSLRRSRTVKPLTISPHSNSPHRHSRSDEFQSPRADVPFKEVDSNVQRPETPFIDTLVPDRTYLTATWSKDQSKPTERRERKEGWSGEWNREDMQDVIQRLRNLK
ncbi:hypothetical protein VKT23_018400 [Stygiomarasmius scandens]|uniref:Uncharacterized protein n=1 Tax=Marasmiellus scandens TaxID=2682957 RepID=A0ABR1ITE8_9AGAR